MYLQETELWSYQGMRFYDELQSSSVQATGCRAATPSNVQLLHDCKIQSCCQSITFDYVVTNNRLVKHLCF